MRLLTLLALALAQSAAAADVGVRVLELFHPQRVELAAPPGGRLVVRDRAVEGGQSIEIRLERLTRPLQVPGPVVVRIAGAIERTFPGRLTIEPAGSELRLVVALPLEEAVAAIVAAEAGEAAPPGAQRSQAIATRSFLLASKGRHQGYGFCDTTHCQHFTEAERASHEATQATAGLVLEYQGAVLEALSTRRCGGKTRTLRGIGLNGHQYPYFPVACEPCRRTPSPWERTWPAAKLERLLANPGHESGRLAVVRKLGWSAVPSNAYALHREGAQVTLRGRGEGHGVGLCQFGAAELARQGWDAARILRHYFVNATVGER